MRKRVTNALADVAMQNAVKGETELRGRLKETDEPMAKRTSNDNRRSTRSSSNATATSAAFNNNAETNIYKQKKTKPPSKKAQNTANAPRTARQTQIQQKAKQGKQRDINKNTRKGQGKEPMRKENQPGRRVPLRIVNEDRFRVLSITCSLPKSPHCLFLLDQHLPQLHRLISSRIEERMVNAYELLTFHMEQLSDRLIPKEFFEKVWKDVNKNVNTHTFSQQYIRALRQMLQKPWIEQLPELSRSAEKTDSDYV